ncbi:MAG: AAA family ATPase [Bacteroidaceae bacterium]|nr:AAA family ATPase [Bacteroidaceae bacterium]
METFFKSHAFLVERTNAPIRRALMDTIDWSYRMIGIRGPRGVGRTNFLLQYAKENFDPRLRQCLYVNMNNFYFQARGIVTFAGEFVENGGRVLLIDQAFKLPDWRKQLIECYHRYPTLRIVYSTTSVQDADAETSELNHLARTYYLHGFSFREFLNLKYGTHFRTYTLNELLENHEIIARSILREVRPLDAFEQYLHHGYYPFFLENHNFTEALLKAMNMMIEVDVLFIKQIELKYLERLKNLLYLLAVTNDTTANVSQLALDIGTSRATVMNYLKYLEEARLVNMIYREGDSFPKKPAAVMLHDTNLLHCIYNSDVSEQRLMETFFTNALWRHNRICRGHRKNLYTINSEYEVCVCEPDRRVKTGPKSYAVRYGIEMGRDKDIPVWLFGFLQ